MFYDNFCKLCEQKEISCKKAATEIGLSNSICTKWKKTGATPNGETLEKIARYFNVSVSYLLYNDDGLTEMQRKVIAELSDDELKDAISYIMAKRTLENKNKFSGC